MLAYVFNSSTATSSFHRQLSIASIAHGSACRADARVESLEPGAWGFRWCTESQITFIHKQEQKAWKSDYEPIQWNCKSWSAKSSLRLDGCHSEWEHHPAALGFHLGRIGGCGEAVLWNGWYERACLCWTWQWRRGWREQSEGVRLVGDTFDHTRRHKIPTKLWMTLEILGSKVKLKMSYVAGLQDH